MVYNKKDCEAPDQTPYGGVTEGRDMEAKLTSGKTLFVSEGESLYAALKRQGEYLISSCGGKGTCGKCKLRIIKGNAAVLSSGTISSIDRDASIVLACQTFPSQDMLIEIPQESRLVVGDKIALSKSRDFFELLQSFRVELSPIVKRLLLDIPPPTIHDNISDLERLKMSLEKKDIRAMRFSHGFVTSMGKAFRDAGWKIALGYTDGLEAILISDVKNKEKYGLAIDIGTTTVVVYFVDLVDGRVIDVGSTYNSQMRYGDDVITRIIHATEGRGLDDLRDAIVSDINDLLAPLIERHQVCKEDIESIVIAGNTTMSHLFWGLDPASIREEPYIPTISFFPTWKAGIARIRINSQAPVFTVPCVASYVGGDIVAGVLASQMHRNRETALLMDIGTNGEIAIGNDEWLMTAACSAGPCFEGSGIKHGMRATEGAIESVRINPDTCEPVVGVIGNATPIGICGSGMIDAISEMFLFGVIDQKGKMVQGKRTDRIRKGDEGIEFVLYRGTDRDVVLSETDIENVLRAKAAIYAGVSLLLKEVGFGMDAIEKVYIAGGFGNYLNVDKAIILGMLPDLPMDKFSFLGNTSITGAYLCLLSEELRKEAEDIASKMTYTELSVSRGFMDEYMSALFLPHTDMGRFPTVEALLKRKHS
jgi:uncharacterized 2Fe-2S/4Fe-4S cluster protein (DUF4445 family)